MANNDITDVAVSPDEPHPFRTFVRDISRIVERETQESRILAQVDPTLTALIAVDNWLPADFRQPDPERYLQYLLYCDPQERFSVVSFVWGPGQLTPVHNHETWGAIGILGGAEISQKFRFLGDALVPEGSPRMLRCGEVEILSAAEGDIHQVRNGYDDRPSVAIHVYGANIGAHPRSIFKPNGERQPFISRYKNNHLPNFW